MEASKSGFDAKVNILTLSEALVKIGDTLSGSDKYQNLSQMPTKVSELILEALVSIRINIKNSGKNYNHSHRLS